MWSIAWRHLETLTSEWMCWFWGQDLRITLSREISKFICPNLVLMNSPQSFFCLTSICWERRRIYMRLCVLLITCSWNHSSVWTKFNGRLEDTKLRKSWRETKTEDLTGGRAITSWVLPRSKSQLSDEGVCLDQPVSIHRDRCCACMELPKLIPACKDLGLSWRNCEGLREALVDVNP